MSHERRRWILTSVWLVGAAFAIGMFLFRREAIEDLLHDASGTSLVLVGAIYLLLGCVRSFTLIPVTSLVVLGTLFLPPWILFALTLVGIVVSSAAVYYFSEALHLDELLKKNHAGQLERVRGLLERHGFPIVVGWAFFPIVPTDLICYLAGVIRMSIAKLLIGVALGEGAICAIYIFLGDSLLHAIGWR
ncbi:MAG: TVP38/TMEM64 family protein [Deltaproteobacteria bacterium]|nr:TVP38/TMEM64 family protein [Deltaproteobacteria bacterium]